MSESLPSVSVVVPVYDDPAGVRDTLSSLVEQTYPADRHEVVVVDNDSTDATPDVVASFADRHETVSLAFERRIQSSYAARNRGIEATDGDLLLFVDADVTVPETWIADVVERFRRTDVDYLGCAVELYQPEGESSFVGEYDCATAFPIETLLRHRQFAPTCCLAVRRAVIEAVGPFRPDLVSGGDREFGERVAAAGYVQGFAPEIVVYHPSRSTLREVASKAVRVGRGQEQLRQRYSGTATSRPIYHPLNALPPDPWLFSRRLSGDVGVARWLAFYALAYVAKCCRLYGRLVEHAGAERGDDGSTRLGLRNRN